jgi:hypothetical protein
MNEAKQEDGMFTLGEKVSRSDIGSRLGIDHDPPGRQDVLQHPRLPEQAVTMQGRDIRGEVI